MMYNNKLALAVRTDGKILREFKDSVYLPFGNEYQLVIKNLNSVRALVTVKIDGTTVSGNGLVLNSGQTLDLERSLANGNLAQGNKFKFIERTDSIEQYRGIKLEDGLIEVSYQFERAFKFNTYRNDDYWASSPGYPDYPTGTGAYPKGMMRSVGMNSATASTMSTTASVSNDAGITVPGSFSDQKFSSVAAFPVESETHVMILKLLGQTADNQVLTAPVTVKTKQKCPTCGHLNEVGANFCVKCGTALTVY